MAITFCSKGVDKGVHFTPIFRVHCSNRIHNGTHHIAHIHKKNILLCGVDAQWRLLDVPKLIENYSKSSKQQCEYFPIYFVHTLHSWFCAPFTEKSFCCIFVVKRLVGLLVRSIFRGKNCSSASARVQFSSEKISIRTKAKLKWQQ